MGEHTSCATEKPCPDGGKPSQILLDGCEPCMAERPLVLEQLVPESHSLCYARPKQRLLKAADWWDASCVEVL